MEIRECRAGDLAVLEKHMPSRFHEARYRRQADGRSTFLIAWLDDGVPAGSGEILWDGCGDSVVQATFPGCPELSGLIVWPPSRQSGGIGTALVHAAEALVAGRGIGRLGMGVDDANPRAAALYLRLGYADHGCHYRDRYHWIDDEGARHDVADPCRFLVKELTTGPGTAGRPG